MKKIILFILYSFLTIFSNAQSPTFQWAKNMGGSGDHSEGRSVAVDASGNIYTTGFFNGIEDFNPGAGIFNLTSVGSNDIFVSKLDASGNFVWAKDIGGTSNEQGNSIVVNTSGVYITGGFQGIVDFDPGAATFNLSATSSSYDIFILKLNTSGNLVWVKTIGDAGDDVAWSISVDKIGNISCTGRFQGAVDFNPGGGTFNLLSASGSEDIFILKLDSVGNFIFAKRIGGSLYDDSQTIVVDTFNNIYITGYFQGAADFDTGPGTYILNSAGNSDIFDLKLDSSGNTLWANRMGATLDDWGTSIAVDLSGNVYTVGYYNDTVDFDPGPGFGYLFSFGGKNIFISKSDSLGNFVWAKNMGGGTVSDEGGWITSDFSGNIYITGAYTGTVDFDPGPGIVSLTCIGGTSVPDVFVLKLDPAANFVWVSSMGGGGEDQAYGIAVDGSNNLYTTGVFQGGPSDYDPGTAIFNLNANGLYDMFVSKLGQSIATSIAIENDMNNIIIYPNPSNGSFNLFISSVIKNGSVEVYNSLGELVLNEKIVNQQNSIELKDHMSGLYFVKVMSDGKIVGTEKIIKQ
jgi:hypothetical protein